MVPVAVTEDTGGSTRTPATCCQNFGFDPSRNHYPNGGNPGLTFTKDQLGLNARSVDDIILYDRALCGLEEVHDAAALAVAARPSSEIRVAAPLVPFVFGRTSTQLPPGKKGTVEDHVEVDATLPSVEADVFYNQTINPDVKGKYDAAKAALVAGGVTVVDAEWERKHFDYLGGEESTIIELIRCNRREVNGHSLGDCREFWGSSLGQMATFVYDYLDAPVSPKEILADASVAGSSHDIANNYDFNCTTGDETQFRYMMGPFIQEAVAIYNSYFDANNADVLIMPAAAAATPDLADCAGKTVQISTLIDGANGGAAGGADGSGNPSVKTERTGDDYATFGLFNNELKYLHIPKLVVPIGLVDGGRPVAVQLWGRAVDYENMFDDAFSRERDVEFLHLAKRVAATIQAAPGLARVDAPFASNVVAASHKPT